jgi:hypothetical protein
MDDEETSATIFDASNGSKQVLRQIRCILRILIKHFPCANWKNVLQKGSWAGRDLQVEKDGSVIG